MKITYPDAERSAIPPERARQGSPLAMILIIVASIAIILAVAWYYYFRISPAPAVTPTAETNQIIKQITASGSLAAPADGVRLCQARTPDIASSDAQRQRMLCYNAVMIIFGTSTICDVTTMDPSSLALCDQAKTVYNDLVNKAQMQQNPATSQQPSGSTNAVNSQGSQGQPGSGNSNTNTQKKPGTGTGNTNSGNTNTNVNTNVNGTTNSNSNTNTSANVNANSNQNTNGSNIDQNPPSATSTPLCINKPGEVVLLQHTNDCQ